MKLKVKIKRSVRNYLFVLNRNQVLHRELDNCSYLQIGFTNGIRFFFSMNFLKYPNRRDLLKLASLTADSIYRHLVTVSASIFLPTFMVLFFPPPNAQLFYNFSALGIFAIVLFSFYEGIRLNRCRRELFDLQRIEQSFIWKLKAHGKRQQVNSYSSLHLLKGLLAITLASMILSTCFILTFFVNQYAGQKIWPQEWALYREKSKLNKELAKSSDVVRSPAKSVH